VVGGPPRLEPSWSSADGQRVRVGLHAHFANEELVVALSGPVTLRTPATLSAALSLGVEDRGTLHQRDTYFHAVHGRLKLREQPPEPPHLVAGLGDFVELEAVASTADGLDAERPRIDRLTDALGIDDSLLVSEGYAEMLEARRPALGVRGRYGAQSATGR
jgi:hypothetical protein